MVRMCILCGHRPKNSPGDAKASPVIGFIRPWRRDVQYMRHLLDIEIILMDEAFPT